MIWNPKNNEEYMNYKDDMIDSIISMIIYIGGIIYSMWYASVLIGMQIFS